LDSVTIGPIGLWRLRQDTGEALLSAARRLRVKAKFSSQINLIWVVQSCREKYFALSAPQIIGILCASRPT
jgi:hypothetical protein